MSDIAIIEVPYHLGRKRIGLGAGTEPLRDALGRDAVAVDRGGEFYNEVSATFTVIRSHACAVAAAFRIRAAALTAYDPRRDPEGRISLAAAAIAARLRDALVRQGAVVA
jgi:hypothetical protein